MNELSAALWCEFLKARRTKVTAFTALGFMLGPAVGGLFMIILKDPQAARSMGLISTKAQLMAGTATWPSYFDMLAQATAVGGAFVFAIFTAWVFGREFSDRTVKEFLAYPLPRGTIIGAKFLIVAAWSALLTVFNFLVGIIVGTLIVLPGWSFDLASNAAIAMLGSGLLTIGLLPFVALATSIGRGYLPAFGWTILSVALAQIAAVMGWGDWFPWSIPALFGGAAGSRSELLGPHSYWILILACVVGTTATVFWWITADHSK